MILKTEKIQRQLPNFRRGKGIKFFQSAKNNKRIWCDSHLELMAYRYLDFKAEVISYKEQPVQYLYKGANGKETGYTVDTEVIGLESEIKQIEIKPLVFVNDPEEKERFRYFRNVLLKSKNQLIEYLTDEEVCKGFTQQNLIRLCHLRKLSLVHEQAEEIITSVGSKTTWGILLQTAKDLSISPRMAKLMLAHQKYRFDYVMPLNFETQLTIGEVL
jgi:hypothetical protein